MSSPILWIIIPAVSAGVLYLLRRFAQVVKLLGILIALLLAIFAWLLPIGSPISLGSWPQLPTLVITEQLTILGRNLILSDTARPALVIIYLGAVLWFVGATTIPISRLFIPLSLAISALLTAAISVQPFLYAGLFIELAVLLCIPILAPPGHPVSKGVMRFLTFQTIGMFLLLFASWMMYSVELNANSPVLAVRAAILLSLGFTMTLSIFPFNSWIPMIAKESHPYSTAFIIFTFSEIVSLFAVNLFVRYSWLQSSLETSLWLPLIGLLMIIGGGVFAVFQNNLGRTFGYAIVLEIGLIVVSISQISSGAQKTVQAGDNLIAQIPLAAFFFALILPRGLNLAIWALGLSVLKTKFHRLDFETVKGKGYQFPVAAIGITLAGLSLAGYPLLAGFPVRATLGVGLAQLSPLASGIALIGYFGLVIASLRTISVLLSGKETVDWKISETAGQIALLSLGIAILLIVGFFPQLFLGGLQSIIP